ncbi:MAG: hypothetical protein J4F29_23490 [Candidatus Latescibacteria bacterium]|nr:hypothetical protein [Candidatus Latescibacterota bacterium]
MSHRQTLINAFKRILEIADHDHLYLPFQRDSKLRAKHFPGAGSKIGRKKLIDAYLHEFGDTNPDEKLLQHATYPWIHGYDASLTHILDDLRTYEKKAPAELSTDRRRALEKKFTRTGAEEIAAFWSVYAAADNSYRKSVIEMLARVKPPTPPTIQPTQPPQQPTTHDSPQPEPATQSGYALMGVLIFFVPTLIFTIIQYWRYPNESHYIALSIAGFFGIVTLIFLIDYLRKRNI